MVKNRIKGAGTMVGCSVLSTLCMFGAGLYAIGAGIGFIELTSGDSYWEYSKRKQDEETEEEKKD